MPCFAHAFRLSINRGDGAHSAEEVGSSAADSALSGMSGPDWCDLVRDFFGGEDGRVHVLINARRPLAMKLFRRCRVVAP